MKYLAVKIAYAHWMIRVADLPVQRKCRSVQIFTQCVDPMIQTAFQFATHDIHVDVLSACVIS